jgi:hypothetical protein
MHRTDNVVVELREDAHVASHVVRCSSIKVPLHLLVVTTIVVVRHNLALVEEDVFDGMRGVN